MAHITHVRGLLLKYPPPLLEATMKTRKLTLIDAVINSLPVAPTIEVPDPSAVPLAALAAFCAQFPNDPLQLATKNAVDAWIAALHLALNDLVVLSNGIAVADTLYVVTLPEFGVNGYTDAGAQRFDAAAAFPVELETYIAQEVRTLLTTHFAHARVVFAFSTCVIEPVLYPLGVARNTQKIKGSSRITVVTSQVPVVAPVQIFKGVWADIDNWNRAIYANSYTRPNKATRIAQVNFPLTFPGDAPGASLAFSTCQDVLLDRHGNTNLCVYMGLGLPIYALKDTTHAFLYNDYHAWNGFVVGNMRPLGFYNFINPAVAAPPVGSGLTVNDRLDNLVANALTNPVTRTKYNLYDQLPHDEGIVWQTCWYHSALLEAARTYNVVVTARMTPPIPFPASVADRVDPRRRCNIL